MNSRGGWLRGVEWENDKFAFANHCICPRLTKIYINMQVHRRNNGAPQKDCIPPKRGQNLPKRGNVCITAHRIYRTPTENYPNMSVYKKKNFFIE